MWFLMILNFSEQVCTLTMKSSNQRNQFPKIFFFGWFDVDQHKNNNMMEADDGYGTEKSQSRKKVFKEEECLQNKNS